MRLTVAAQTRPEDHKKEERTQGHWQKARGNFNKLRQQTRLPSSWVGVLKTSF
jgi:ribosomal protein L32E